MAGRRPPPPAESGRGTRKALALRTGEHRSAPWTSSPPGTARRDSPPSRLQKCRSLSQRPLRPGCRHRTGLGDQTPPHAARKEDVAPPAGSGRGGQRGCIHGGGAAWCLPHSRGDQRCWLGGRPGPGPLAPGPLGSGFPGRVPLAEGATVSCNEKRPVGTFPPWPSRDGRTLGPFAVLCDTLTKAGKTPAPDSPSWALSPGLQVASVPLHPSGGCWPSCLRLCSETQATSKTVHLPEERQSGAEIPALGGAGGQVSRPASWARPLPAAGDIGTASGEGSPREHPADTGRPWTPDTSPSPESQTPDTRPSLLVGGAK